jgi:hypothetical protein
MVRPAPRAVTTPVAHGKVAEPFFEVGIFASLCNYHLPMTAPVVVKRPTGDVEMRKL